MKIALHLVTVLTAVMITGCSQGHAPAEDAVSTATLVDGYEVTGSKVDVDAETLSLQGTPPAVDDVQVAGKPSAGRRLTLKRGSRLAALVDHDCIRDRVSPLGSRIAGERSADMRLQAHSFQLTADQTIEELTAEAEADECVLQVSNDIQVDAIAVPNDPSFSRQWFHSAIRSASAWDTFFGANGAQAVTIAVVDTGVDFNHADLRANMWTNARGEFGYDFVNGDAIPMDDHSHGTHCAGLIGAVGGNATGGAGVFPFKVKLMAVKALSRSGSGSSSGIANAINYAVANGAQVISLSLGGPGTSSILRTAMVNAAAKGVVVLAAAGNDSTQITATRFYSPAGYAREIEGALAVGSIDSSLRRSSFSNYGTQYVDLGSPGSSIYSTVINGGYSTMSGTSMATPISAGAAGLVIGFLRGRGINPTAAQVEQLLLAGSVKDPTLVDVFKDGNRLDLKTLVDRLSSQFIPGTPVPEQTPSPAPAPAPFPAPAPAPAPAPPMTPGCGTMNADACIVFKGINNERTSRGLSALQPLSNCTDLAQSHANDMATNNFFSHTSPTQGSFSQRVSRFGLSGGAGENIAAGYTNTSVVGGWMNSAGHRSNILNTRWRSTGVGVRKDSRGRPYYVQCFSSMTAL